MARVMVVDRYNDGSFFVFVHFRDMCKNAPTKICQQHGCFQVGFAMMLMLMPMLILCNMPARSLARVERKKEKRISKTQKVGEGGFLYKAGKMEVERQGANQKNEDD